MNTEETQKMMWRALAAVLSSLTPKERKVLFMRHGINDGIYHTLEEVGKEFGVTRERVRQIEAKASEKIRLFLKDYEDIHTPLANRLTTSA